MFLGSPWCSMTPVTMLVPDTLGEGPGSLWDASGKPPEPPGVVAGGVGLGIHSALIVFHGKYIM